jgi:23S rRNA pseudouridine2457 synthase
MVIAFYKPYGVLSQFTPEPGSAWRTLAEFGLPKRVYAVGRLDADSEGLLLLSDEAEPIEQFHDPEGGHLREYWVQVEGIVGPDDIRRLESGLEIGRGQRTLAARAWQINPPPEVPPRTPPIRFRKSVPDSWIGLELSEGKNRQVRRMTAAIGHPTLRLLRVRIGSVHLSSLALTPGAWCAVEWGQPP